MLVVGFWLLDEWDAVGRGSVARHLSFVKLANGDIKIAALHRSCVTGTACCVRHRRINPYRRQRPGLVSRSAVRLSSPKSELRLKPGELNGEGNS